MILYIVVFSNCIQQIIMIRQIDYSVNVSDIQKRLNLLQARIADYVRLCFLFVPTWLAFPIILVKALANLDLTTMFNHDWFFWNIVFSIAIIPICIWLYNKVSYKNMNKKWVRTIIESTAGDAVTKAMMFTMEIDEYKKGLA